MVSSPTFVIVSWLDAYGDATEEATLANAHQQHKAVRMETAGWLLREDEHGVSIFNERCIDGNEVVYRGKTFIPKGMVVAVQPFKLSKPRKKRGADESQVSG